LVYKKQRGRLFEIISISLSPLYPSLTIDLHLRIAADLQQSFL